MGLCLSLAALLFANSFYIQAKALLAQHLIAQAWQTTLQHYQVNQQQNVKPWAWADTYPVAKLVVKKQGIQQYVLAGANGSPLAFGPGLYAGTQLPGRGNIALADAIIAGHHNTHFDFLKAIKTGDSIQLQNAWGQTFDYRVSRIAIYDIRRQRLPAYQLGNTLQLVTCSPAFLGETNPPLRLVITAELI